MLDSTRSFAERLVLVVVGLFVIGPFVAQRAHGAPLLQTFVMTVGGQSNFSTYSAPDPVYNSFFGRGNALGGVSVPANAFSNPALLASSGIAGSWRQQSAASGALADAMSLNTTFNAGANAYAGSAAAVAQFGSVGASARGSLAGPSGIGLVDGSESYALFRETMSFFSPTIVVSGGTGFARYRFSIDGILSVSGPGTAGVDVLYQHGSHPIYDFMRAQVDPRSGTFIASLAGAATNASGFGFTSSIGPGTAALAGAGVFDTFFEQFDVGTPVDVTLGMMAYSIPGGNAVADAAFSSTARLTGIEIYDRFGRPVTDFLITSSSGTVYDAQGAHAAVTAVPEPAAVWLMGSGLLGMAGAARRRSKQT